MKYRFSLLIACIFMINGLSASALVQQEIEDPRSIEEKWYKGFLQCGFSQEHLFCRLVGIIFSKNEERFLSIATTQKLNTLKMRESRVLFNLAYIHTQYSPILKRLLTADKIRKFDHILEHALSPAAKQNDLPCVRRLCWEFFINEASDNSSDLKKRLYQPLYHEASDNSPDLKKRFYRTLYYVLHYGSNQSVEIVQHFLESIDWDNYQEEAAQLDANIRLHEAIEQHDAQNVISNLCNNPELCFKDEFDELPLIKAKRLGNDTILTYLETYAQHKDTFMSTLEENASQETIQRAIELVRICPALASLRNNNRDTILHLAVLLGDIPFLSEVLSAYPKAIALPNNQNKTAIHYLSNNGSIDEPIIAFMIKGIQNLEEEKQMEQKRAPSFLSLTATAITYLITLPIRIILPISTKTEATS